MNVKPRQLIVAILLLLNMAAAHAASPTVIANSETLTGLNEQGVQVFKGIPFAKPPTGNLRWQAPQPHLPRNGQQQATEFADGCMQGQQMVEWYRDIAEAFVNDREIIQSPKFSEDCLYLNVWTPTTTPKQKMPVMVWIHGGSNKGGWSYEPNYFGHQLAKENVVVVSIAYRLGVFGFISHPQLSKQQPIASNFALHDQIAALQWIQQHISAFGGDAKQVTVFGESAGAADIGYLIATEKANGLFHRAIHQSAGYEIQRQQTLAEHHELGIALSQQLRIDQSDTAMDELRKKSANAILEAAEQVHKGHYYDPAIDQYLFTQPLLELYQNKLINPVDLMIGSNADEWYMYGPDQVTEKHLLETIQTWPKPYHTQLLGIAKQFENPKTALDKISTAWDMLCPSRLIARQLSKHNQVWSYYFTQVRDGIGGQRLKAYHGAEIPYVFNTHDAWLTTGQRVKKLSATMLNYWVNFAKTGNPNTDSLPYWPGFSEHKIMQLGDKVNTIKFPGYGLCDIYDTIKQQQ